jgi:hypothetical protein
MRPRAEGSGREGSASPHGCESRRRPAGVT